MTSALDNVLDELLIFTIKSQLVSQFESDVDDLFGRVGKNYMRGSYIHRYGQFYALQIYLPNQSYIIIKGTLVQVLDYFLNIDLSIKEYVEGLLQNISNGCYPLIIKNLDVKKRWEISALTWKLGIPNLNIDIGRIIIKYNKLSSVTQLDTFAESLEEMNIELLAYVADVEVNGAIEKFIYGLNGTNIPTHQQFKIMLRNLMIYALNDNDTGFNNGLNLTNLRSLMSIISELTILCNTMQPINDPILTGSASSPALTGNVVSPVSPVLANFTSAKIRLNELQKKIAGIKSCIRILYSDLNGNSNDGILFELESIIYDLKSCMNAILLLKKSFNSVKNLIDAFNQLKNQDDEQQNKYLEILWMKNFIEDGAVLNQIQFETFVKNIISNISLNKILIIDNTTSLSITNIQNIIDGLHTLSTKLNLLTSIHKKINHNKFDQFFDS